MDDNFYYRVKAIEADLEWMARVARKEGMPSLVDSEAKRTAIRKMLVNVGRHVQTIQATMADPVVGEFKDVEVQ